MRITTQLRKRDEVKRRINELFSHAAFYGIPHAEMMESKAAIWADIAKCSGWVKDYLQGWYDAKMDEAYKANLVHGFEHNGKFYSTYSKRADYYGNAMEPSAATAILSEMESGHFWETKHYGMKPFFLSRK
jgi:hypothetical protein